MILMKRVPTAICPEPSPINPIAVNAFNIVRSCQYRWAQSIPVYVYQCTESIWSGSDPVGGMYSLKDGRRWVVLTHSGVSLLYRTYLIYYSKQLREHIIVDTTDNSKKVRFNCCIFAVLLYVNSRNCMTKCCFVNAFKVTRVTRGQT